MAANVKHISHGNCPLSQSGSDKNIDFCLLTSLTAESLYVISAMIQETWRLGENLHPT